MTEAIHFHTDLYSREALELAAQRYRDKARVELADSGADVVARLEPLLQAADAQELLDEFCTDAFSATARRWRDLGKQTDPAAAGSEPQWALLAPFRAGTTVGLGWELDSLSPVRGDAAVLVLRHQRHGIARVTIRRKTGAPQGIAHTDHLDFMLMNGGGGTAPTENSIERILKVLAIALRRRGDGGARAALALFAPEPDKAGANGTTEAAPVSKRITPRIDIDAGAVSFEFEEAGISRSALYDAVLPFADRCYVFLTRPDANRVGVQLKTRANGSANGAGTAAGNAAGQAPTDVLRVLARDVTNALNHSLRKTTGGSGSGARDRHTGLPRLARPRIDMETLLAELDAADPTTVGVGFSGERGPGHENLRVLNIRGTGACNSECVFCIEKFNPGHRPMPKADATRQLILDSAGRFDMLFFASGEPTIHPKLFEYVELARSVGFTCFGMSSHFRTFADPQFALKTLEAGFEYFDIALHAADLDAQLDVNPIGDNGQSLYEALKGLGVLLRLADTLGIRISITHKIVVSRLNVTQLEPIVRATYDRGVRHFILQPVRSMGLAPELQTKLEISEEEILPHLNELLHRTAGLGAIVKPYGFSRQNLFSGGHIETEQNRVKNIYGKARRRDAGSVLPNLVEERPTDGRHWVEVRDWESRVGFPSDGSAPVLDDGLQRGLRLNFGCRMGSCGMCCARLLEGSVDQSTQIFLSEEQVQQGFVLLCQARPLSDVVVRVCTEDEIDEL